jgi:hypothetical protein
MLTAAARNGIGVEDLRDQKILSFSRQNLSYTESYFAEKFAEYDLTRNIACTCDDTFSLVSLVSGSVLRRNGQTILPKAISRCAR